ncbi:MULTISPECIES: peptide chain release factor 1 [unclassified Leptolyngbya]|uniref:peptide chain release factor 1 n=1 Tax=unclassified Leptolyngbya TaxID=2650499 RepID=UPI0016849169|nr:MULTISPECIES: peptide chain release factor 1 [unclassified Leptolyngbya]MBD1909544.1 peptide chain release factor 1 [Leptolyngbya sp. FACHB-8]MBD2154082.1 peptide chain release factor 1 [Leptolyngbya sp. FACHB-16]
MRNPFQRLRSLPWVPLLLIAAMTLVIIFGIEMLLGILIQVSNFEQVLQLLFTPPLGLLMIVAIGVGVGAIAVWLLETLRPEIIINSGVLWALIGCLILVTFIRQLLPGFSLVTLDESTLMGMIVGVFLTGRRYWR